MGEISILEFGALALAEGAPRELVAGFTQSQEAGGYFVDTLANYNTRWVASGGVAITLANVPVPINPSPLPGTGIVAPSPGSVLPTTDPHVVGQEWINGGIVVVSQG